MASGSMAFLNPHQSPHPAPGQTFSPNVPNSFLPPPPLHRAPPSNSSAANDIVNQRADTSLYQTCIQLRRRLAFVPNFEDYLRDMDLEEMDNADESDPVTSMWNMLRQGEPLLTIYNATNPAQKSEIDRNRVKESAIPKAATFKFLQACFDDLMIPQDQCFLVTDLYGQDTTGFVKVLKVINRVVDILQARNLLYDAHDEHPAAAVEPQQKSHSEMVVAELVNTERNYVQHLETLQNFKDQLEQSGMLPGDTIHDIFLNLNNLLDFQQRFLIRIEQQNAIDPAAQNWGALFVQYRDGFRVYEPFIGNQNHGNETVTKNWSVIERAQYTPEVLGMVGSVTVLTGFLLKPFQRLSKYPLLLDELRKKAEKDPDADPAKTQDLTTGATAMKAVLDRANALLQKADLAKEVAELVTLVDDWKGHQLSHFGDLVMSGTWPVVKGETSKDAQRDYKIFLFERMLLCCKELNPNKAKNRLQGKSSSMRQGKAKLQLKGRIFIQNICDVVQLQPSQNGSASYTLQIWWKGDPGIESFTIRFPAAEHQKKWFDQILELRHQFPSNNRTTLNPHDALQHPNLISLSGLTLENPYEQDEDSDDPRASQATTLVNDGLMFASRNASANSLPPRSRSATGSSAARGAPPRFPMAEPPVAQPHLRLATGAPQTPEDRLAGSAFSPANDSPASSRISQQGPGGYPFPRASSVGHWAPEGNKHNTAPPGPRPQYQLHEEHQHPSYGMNGRSFQRPSLPAVGAHPPMHHAPMHGASHSTSQLPTMRNRSISSPDTNGFTPGGRRTPNGQAPMPGEEVPVPPLPPNVANMRGPVNRSNTNSPTDNLRNARGMGPPHPGSHGPTGMRQLQHYNSYAYDQTHAALKTQTPIHGAAGRVLSPSLSASAVPPPPPAPGAGGLPYVSQLKVKVHYEPDPDSNYVTIVIGSNIGWETLRGRIDHKMQKNTAAQIADGTARLRYVDQENDPVTINEDEDVDMAIEVWKEKCRAQLAEGRFPELDLFWKEVEPRAGG